MPFSAFFALFALFATGGIFLVSLKKRGLKTALFYSGIASAVFIAIFIVFLNFLLNNM